MQRFLNIVFCLMVVLQVVTEYRCMESREALDQAFSDRLDGQQKFIFNNSDRITWAQQTNLLQENEIEVLRWQVRDLQKRLDNSAEGELSCLPE